MKNISLLSLLFLSAVITLNAQNLYSSSNAASIENEANTTTGWISNASLTSDSSTVQNGSYSLRIAVLNSGRDARYNFDAVVGTVYNISIWARRTANSNNPAFANWLGLQGFTTTVINSLEWTQYNFTVTATITSPAIRVYAGPIGAANGMEVFIDAISITTETPADTEPPTAPVNLQASAITPVSATVSWLESTDNTGVTSYIIREDDVVVGQVSGSVLLYEITGLNPETSYTITVQATDAAGNLSPESDSLIITTLALPPDTIAPSIPANLIASGISENSISLSWSASTDNIGVAGYRIYMDSVLIDSTVFNQYQVTGLDTATLYVFYISAYDTSRNISDTSIHLPVTTTVPGQLITYTSSNSNLPTVDWQAANLYASGNVGIATLPNPEHRLSVNGNIRAKEITVETGWSDFVFEPDYPLATLEEVEDFILKYGHLKDIPTEEDVRENGIGLARMNKLLLMKIEEITLYLIQSNKKIRELEQKVELLKPLY